MIELGIERHPSKKWMSIVFSPTTESVVGVMSAVLRPTLAAAGERWTITLAKIKSRQLGASVISVGTVIVVMKVGTRTTSTGSFEMTASDYTEKGVTLKTNISVMSSQMP